MRLSIGWSIGSGLVAACCLLAACGGGARPAPAPETRPEYKARMAESLLNAGRVGEALETMREAVAADPQRAPLHHQYGQLCFRAGRFDEAEAAFRRALELDPYMTDSRNYLGTVYQEVGRYEDAEKEYLRALEDRAYPTPEKVYLNLGILYSKLGRDDDAVTQMRRAVEVDPKYYLAHFQLAGILERTGRLEEAAREYEVAEPAFRNSGDYFYRKGFTYFRLGQLQQARDSLSRVLTIAPGSESAAQADELLRMID